MTSVTLSELLCRAVAARCSSSAGQSRLAPAEIDALLLADVRPATTLPALCLQSWRAEPLTIGLRSA